MPIFLVSLEEFYSSFLHSKLVDFSHNSQSSHFSAMLATKFTGCLVWLLLVFQYGFCFVKGNRILQHEDYHQLPIASNSKILQGDQEKVKDGEKQAVYKVNSRIGSHPPWCKNKCRSCNPCQAVEVPTVPQKGRGAGTLDYSNYKPLTWKCRCRQTLFNP